jgi:hypothetical protein
LVVTGVDPCACLSVDALDKTSHIFVIILMQMERWGQWHTLTADDCAATGLCQQYTNYMMISKVIERK